MTPSKIASERHNLEPDTERTRSNTDMMSVVGAWSNGAGGVELNRPDPATLCDFPPLQFDPDAERRQARVCIVSPEFVGPTRNGGVGTAYTSLAHVLAQAGHEVTIYYTGGEWIDNPAFDEWERHYFEKGILFVAQKAPPRISVDARYIIKQAYEVFLWLKQREERFDIVHFPEWQGQGYFCLLAKKQGIAFPTLTFCVGVHSSTTWVELGNQRLFEWVDQLDEDFLERESVRLADVVISPSQYLLRWMLADGWRLPARVFLSPYAMPAELSSSLENSGSNGRPAYQGAVRELIFFGRLEPRKGLFLFCDALDLLSERSTSPEIHVTFLGKTQEFNGQNSTDYIQSRAASWKFKVQVLTKDRHLALSYLRSKGGRLAVIPSIIENYPNTVLECLDLGIPFVASAVGGIPEQIAHEDRERVLFEPTARSLAKKLEEAIADSPRPASPAIDFLTNNETLVRWHEQFRMPSDREISRPAVIEPPLVSVCLTHFNRPVYLRWALESLRKQDYSRFEVILVDDGSTTSESQAYLERLEPEFRERGWQIVRQENGFLGAARNAAARHSRGKYLLFMDDDNYATPGEISTMVAVAERIGADILTCVKNLWEGTESPNDGESSNTGVERHWVPLGPALASGLYWNAFGDANALVKRETFEALGGFTEAHGVTCEDWEFFARAVMAGFDLQVIPLPLFWYRVHYTSMMYTTDSGANRLLTLRPYLAQAPPSLRGIFLLTAGQKIRLERLQNQQSVVAPPVSKDLLAELDALWASRSWKMFRPLRNLHRSMKGFAKEEKLTPQTDLEAAREIIAMRHSLSWELTFPVRSVHRVLTSFRSKGKHGP
jgi:O-antigen biosynthesis protein